MSKNKRKNIHTVAFYNVENLFDTVDNPKTADDDYTSKGKRRWTQKRYNRKIKKLSSVISQLGSNMSFHAPAIVGLVEVENSKVVQDIIHHKNLKKFTYSYVHYDSPDERGIDVALIYQKKFFEVQYSKTFSLELTDEDGEPDYTRDILLVTGKLNGELVHIFVNHWPSRRDGQELTEPQRIKASKLLRKAMDEVKRQQENPKFIIMGDFNDDPASPSVKQYLVTSELYNPMESLHEKGLGTLTFNKKWNLFDQIIISRNFFDESTQHSFLYAEVFNKDWLRVYSGKLKSSPFRTYIGPWYKGGFSDHFPVYIYFKTY